MVGLGHFFVFKRPSERNHNTQLPLITLYDGDEEEVEAKLKMLPLHGLSLNILLRLKLFFSFTHF